MQTHLAWRRVAPCRFALAILSLAPVPSALATSAPAEIERRVEELVGRMTLEEKIGQLNLESNNPSFDTGEIERGHIGGVLAFNAAPQIAAAQTAARRSRHGIPLLVGLDVLHGLRTMFPVPIAEAASFDPELARNAARISAREATAIGINWTFAPMADLARDVRWGRALEGFGEDPYLGQLFTAARVKGFREGGLATSLKHFAGYGFGAGGRDYDAASISTGELFDIVLPPFRAGIDAGAESVMSGFHTLNGMPATANSRLTNDILRKRWAYDGFVTSDWEAIPQLMNHGVAATPAEAARRALTAGIDVDMASGLYKAHLAEEVRAGRVPEAAVTEGARRVVRAKLRMGLFERPLPDLGITDTSPPTAETREDARRAARESMVLLRNEGVLPLRGARRIAVIGGMAESREDPVGPHAALWRMEDTVPLADGIRRRAEAAGGSVIHAAGCDAFCLSADGFDAAEKVAAEADLVVAVLGEPIPMTGEGGSRAHLTLPGLQSELLRRLLDTGKPVVLVLLASRPIELGPAIDRLAGLLMAWFPGTEGGNAVADILFGDADPAAKLPVTWPRTIGQVPIYYDTLPTGRPHEPGNRYTLRYADELLSPLFPFGFGMTYARFSLTGLEVVKARLARTDTAEFRVRIANVGPVRGREVIQLYVRQPVATVSRPVKQLKAFAKVALEPGETRVVTLQVRAADLGYTGEDGAYMVEPGAFQVLVGTSSDTVMSAAFEVTP